MLKLRVLESNNKKVKIKLFYFDFSSSFVQIIGTCTPPLPPIQVDHIIFIIELFPAMLFTLIESGFIEFIQMY